MYFYISNDMFVQTTFEAICGIHETHPDIYITWIDNVGIGFNKTCMVNEYVKFKVDFTHF
jgi:hypothetical protein